MIRRTILIVYLLTICGGGASCASKQAEHDGREGWDLIIEEGLYPVMCWDGLRPDHQLFDHPTAGLASLKECGYTIVGFVRPEQLDRCEKLGLRAILRPTGHPIKWQELSDAQIEQTVQKMVDESRGQEAVIGFFITDEPGIQKFPALGKAVAAVRKLAPGKLAYINLFPDYATIGAPNLSQLGTENYTEYLERYVSEVNPQFVSYDNYRVLFSDDLTNAKRAASYYNNLLEVRRVAGKHGLPFWNIVSSNQIRPVTPIPSPANLQFQAYTTLAAGAKGLTWFTYYARNYGYPPIDKAGNRTATWSYLKMVNEHVKALGSTMSRLKSTGVYFGSPAPVESLPVLPGKVIEKVESPTPVMVGEFVDPSGNPYAMVVNLSLERSTKIRVTTAANQTNLKYMSPADGSLLPLDADNMLWLTAGQGALIVMPGSR